MKAVDSEKAFAIYIVLIKAYTEYSISTKTPFSPNLCESLAKDAIHAASVFESAVDDSIQDSFEVKK